MSSVLGVLLSSPAILWMLLVGQFAGALAGLGGVLFMPSCAMFLGEITKTSRAFELLLIVATYLILNGVSFFMYIVVHPDLLSSARSLIYFMVGVVMGTVTVIKRVKAPV